MIPKLTPVPIYITGLVHVAHSYRRLHFLGSAHSQLRCACHMSMTCKLKWKKPDLSAVKTRRAVTLSVKQS